MLTADGCQPSPGPPSANPDVCTPRLLFRRIQNCKLWNAYAAERLKVAQQNQGDPNEAVMWHGTKATPPEQIYGDMWGPGFDMRYGNRGMWGQGSYFAEDAAYSARGYAHRDTATGNFVVLQARVTQGNVDRWHTPNNALRLPRYGCHSVSAYTNGSRISILYETVPRAYPEYELTFTNKDEGLGPPLNRYQTQCQCPSAIPWQPPQRFAMCLHVSSFLFRPETKSHSPPGPRLAIVFCTSGARSPLKRRKKGP